MNNNVSLITKNPLRTRKDVIELFHQISEPLLAYFSEGSARLHVGDTNAHYGHDIAGMEAFSRVLWGLIPLLAGGGESKLWKIYMEGMKNGTNPNHEEYWGEVHDFDQRLVEMAVFGYALALAPEKIWDPLTNVEKDRLYKWLNQINQKELVPSNWQFFRVLVNIGFASVGLPYDKEKQEESLLKMESYYMGDGWYSDGHNEQQDYYISFAFHFYGLIYAKVMKEKDQKRSREYIDRAVTFSEDYIYWFASDGSALPFGRSLTYRFAQGAFWSALAFADVEVMDWGVVKGLVLRHLRWWMKQPIFTKDGLLTIGYAYPNLMMSENYNAPGSPYWALKTFLVLTLSEDHPFWQSEEKPLPSLEKRKVQKHPRMIICHNEKQDHVFSLTSGQYLKSVHGQNDAKYGKFAYSNQFGFCIQKGIDGLGQGAFDSMLSLSERDGYYRVRKRCEVVKWEKNSLYSLWKPWHDVKVETWLIPINEWWHVRINRIDSYRELDTVEGGFSIPIEKDGVPTVPKVNQEESILQSENGVAVLLTLAGSGIRDMFGERTHTLVKTDPNTNVLYSSPTYIPSLKGSMEKGSVKWFGSAIFSSFGDEDPIPVWEEFPKVDQNEESFHVYYKGNIIYEAKFLK
ncbi:hypothetical protein J2S74_004803 [Evansella vedderi]|uniref:DUF2264 domain-containing protein n=1 Tax=Evansella vedderi TaxID=38282 RepID=A0ABU0A285_9BACI|nr:DUF2264 domain-containing protein [Evansella vedderi]MDQ0257345.1 hypothetical protein [Evansella vedderi]